MRCCRFSFHPHNKQNRSQTSFCCACDLRLSLRSGDSAKSGSLRHGWLQLSETAAANPENCAAPWLPSTKSFAPLTPTCIWTRVRQQTSLHPDCHLLTELDPPAGRAPRSRWEPCVKTHPARRIGADRGQTPIPRRRERRCEPASVEELLTFSAEELREKQLQQNKPPDVGPHLRNRLWSCECKYNEGSPRSHTVRAFPSVAPLRSVCERVFVCVCCRLRAFSPSASAAIWISDADGRDSC